MKRLTLVLLGALLSAGFNSILAQTIYVNAAATGANNGSSWADAYTDLQDALDAAGQAASNRQVWVAKGTYRPTGQIDGFSLAEGTILYGGFAGTETALSQRNIAANVTTLSGDINNDDITGDFTQKRSDNARHVLWISQSSSNDPGVVDGFSIRGGNTLTGTANATLTRRGGGILVQGLAVVRNCYFTDNFAETGGGLAASSGLSNNFRADNCVFEKNRATENSAGLYLGGLAVGAEVNNCVFRDNITNRGSLGMNSCKNIIIDSCILENNKAGANQWGAAFYNWQSSYTMSNCTFRANQAHNGSGMYNDGRDGGNSFKVENCLFEDHTALSYGGSAMYNYICNVDVLNCTFLNNNAPTSAAAIYYSSCKGKLENSIFEGNSARFGGAIANYSEGSEIEITGCTFTANNVAVSGGAVNTGFTSVTTFKNCVFDGNTAANGGAIGAQNDSTTIVIDGCNFVNNSCENAGGAIRAGGGIWMDILNSSFSLSVGNFGGVVYFVEDSLDLAVLRVDRCTFFDNSTTTQAGVFNLSNADFYLTNSLLYNNLNFSSEGAGGVISNNAGEGKTSSMWLVNNTFSGNLGPLGNDIAQWEDADTSRAVMYATNNIFHTPFDSYKIEAGNPEVISNGGNLSGDNSWAPYFTASKDLNEIDPEFVDASNFDFNLKEISPCVNGGVITGAPTVDIRGWGRVGEPDKGAFELGAVGTSAPGLEHLPIKVTPNPAVDRILLRVENEWIGPVSVRIVSANGAISRDLSFEKNNAQFNAEIPVRDLPSGAWYVQMRQGQKQYGGAFVKQ
jgi:hypothetical protein